MQTIGPAQLDHGCSVSDLPSDEMQRASRALVVEQDRRTSKHSVTLTIDPDHRVGVQLGCAVWGSRYAGRRFRLRRRVWISENLPARGLAQTNTCVHQPDRLEQSGNSDSVY